MHWSKSHVKIKLFLRGRCCCGLPARFLRSWRILRGSFTKPCTQWGPTSSVRDTQWACWTWPKTRYAEETWEASHLKLCYILIYLNSYCCQEFFDEWAIKLGEQEPYKGPKTPDGRVSAALCQTPLNQSRRLTCACLKNDALVLKTPRKSTSTRSSITCWRTKRKLKLSRKYSRVLFAHFYFVSRKRTCSSHLHLLWT